MSYKGFFKPVNPGKYAGNAKNIVYRSSYELTMMSRFDLDENVISWGSEEFYVWYLSPLDKKWHRYFPDMVVEYRNGKKVIIEIKPFRETIPPKPGKSKRRLMKEAATYAKNTAKWEAAEKFATNRGYEFQIWTENEIYGRK